LTVLFSFAGAVLTAVVLTGVVLTGVVLTGAVLTGAALTGLCFADAVLTAAALIGAALGGACPFAVVKAGVDFFARTFFAGSSVLFTGTFFATTLVGAGALLVFALVTTSFAPARVGSCGAGAFFRTFAAPFAGSCRAGAAVVVDLAGVRVLAEAVLLRGGIVSSISSPDKGARG
jgi:uncharacterized protein YjbI with pentapeptide repeats